ncbi:MAG TPA: APC family permease, partial [Thiolinea sp.]|nr:APC family permease [Thiolinea sp.]
LVAVLGYRSIDLSTKILGSLVLAEYAIVMIVDAAIAFKGGAQGLSLSDSFSPGAFFSGSPAIGILFCFAAFIGFESTTIYREEARNPTVTVPRATYISVLIIGVFYMITSWLMVNGEGADKLVPTLQGLADPTTFLFGLAERYVGSWAPPIMSFLLVTSLFAGILAFHNAVARYIYVAGRSGLLPSGLGKTHPSFQSPYVASITQTIIAATVVAIFVLTKQDPVLALFSWLTNVATLAIIVLMFLTALAIYVFFKKNPNLNSNPLTTKISPLVSGALLLVLVVFITLNFAGIAGANGFMAVFLPSLVIIAGLIGWVLALRLRSANPSTFSELGKNIDEA